MMLAEVKIYFGKFDWVISTSHWMWEKRCPSIHEMSSIHEICVFFFFSLFFFFLSTTVLRCVYSWDCCQKVSAMFECFFTTVLVWILYLPSRSSHVIAVVVSSVTPCFCCCCCCCSLSLDPYLHFLVVTPLLEDPPSYRGYSCSGSLHGSLRSRCWWHGSRFFSDCSEVRYSWWHGTPVVVVVVVEACYGSK